VSGQPDLGDPPEASVLDTHSALRASSDVRKVVLHGREVCLAIQAPLARPVALVVVERVRVRVRVAARAKRELNAVVEEDLLAERLGPVCVAGPAAAPALARGADLARVNSPEVLEDRP
jgi:hypothetical protein